ncbi:hypothetical protein AAFG07_35385 [Bradyrhizobium sp. B097]|uniref:hypothetical protein n=1 Tax=Bradyrhizobium sp. B097 TaxID=3140244 RepID=UPI003182CB96
MTEPRNAAFIAAVDASKLRLLRDEAIPTKQSPHFRKADLDRAVCSSSSKLDWGGLLSAGCAKLHTRKIESIEARDA